jgi:YVTN family beta-propeller protein
MAFGSRYLSYESGGKGSKTEFGIVVGKNSDSSIDIEVDGKVLRSVGSKLIFTPQIGDWVALDWSGSVPYAQTGSKSNIMGLSNINESKLITSPSQMAESVVNSTHIQADSIISRHISANSIDATMIQANAITSEKIQAGAITAREISSSTITSDEIVAGSITGDRLQAGTITANEIASSTITSDKIQAGAITATLIATDSIDSNHIKANAITTSELSANSVTSTQIASNSIDANHIKAGVIDATKLSISAKQKGLLGFYYQGNAWNTFKGTQLDSLLNFTWGSGNPTLVGQADNFSIRWQGMIYASETGIHTFYLKADDWGKVSVNNTTVVTTVTNNVEQSATIFLTQGNWYPIFIEYKETTGNANFYLKWRTPSGSGAVDIPSDNLTPENTIIDGGTITTGSITATQIAVGTITAGSAILASASVTNATIADLAVTTAKIADATITNAKIQDATITGAKIQDATITNAKITNLSGDKIDAGTITATQIQAGTITGDRIKAGTIDGDRIKANTIDSTNIKAGAITAVQIAGGTITGDKIQAGTITGDVIRAGSITTDHISTTGLDAQSVFVYNSQTGETLIGGGYLRVDGLDVGVVQSDNLVANGLFLTSSSSYGFKMDTPEKEAILGSRLAQVGSNQVWKIDLTTGQKVKEINVPSMKPFGINIDEDGLYAYVTVHGDNTIMQLDLATDIFTTNTRNAEMSPSLIRYTGGKLGDHKHFFILNTDDHDHHIPDSLMVLDVPPHSVNNSLYVHHTIPLGNNPVDLVMDSNKFTYITMGKQGDIVILDASPKESYLWKVVGRIPISAYATDNYHGGLPATYGLNMVTGGDASGQYSHGNMDMAGMAGMVHDHGGYGSAGSDLIQYNPRGIELSADSDTLYVIDTDNDELVIVDKYGKAPYNYVTGNPTSSSSPSDAGGSMDGHDHTSMTTTSYGWNGGPPTKYVRYRINVGDSPESIAVANGKLFITLGGTGQIAIVDESAILNEIALDRAFYDQFWTTTSPMRTINHFYPRKVTVGSKPSYITYHDVTGKIYVTLSGQNQIAVINPTTETVERYINTGSNPKQFAITPNNQYLYVSNYGGSGELSFTYPSGGYIGDPYLGLEGGIEFQGGEFWTPSRSPWVYDANGNVQSMSTVEFRINEPFLNEGGYVKFTATGKDAQYSMIEQDVYNVVNYSNGDNIITVVGEKLRANETNTVFSPKYEWINTPAPSNIKICSLDANGNKVTTPATPKSILYGANPVMTFDIGVVPAKSWVEVDYTARNNIYFKQHNASALIAIENNSSPNLSTQFEVDEFVPKFVVFDNTQTSSFTPTADGVNETYTGLEYSAITNRAQGRTTITASATPTTGTLTNITDGNYDTEITMPSGVQYVTVDLGKKYMCGKVQVMHKHTMVETTGTDRKYHNTKTQVSEDGITWFTVYDSAVSGEYLENAYHPVHMHRHDGKPIFFDARPVRYIRDYASGWTEYDINSVATGVTGTNPTWAEVMVFADWEIEETTVYPDGTDKAGQQIASNGKSYVSTDISQAFIALNIQIEYTTWWYMTYVVGPQYGEVSIEMPTAMNSSHSLFQEAPYLTKVAHRHIMAFPPSNNIKEDLDNGIVAGKHRVVIKQKSGRVTLDRLRFEDFQYYQRSSLSIPASSAKSTFQRYKIVAEQAKWYKGTGRQATEGAFDAPRKNPDTGLLDYSVPIKYRVRLKSQLNPTGTVDENGVVFATSIIMETGKLHTHWRPSASSDKYPAHKIETWNPMLPHKTGIQSHHIANGAIQGTKILANSIMDYHISNYAKISEHKLDLKYPTHGHGRMTYVPNPNGGADVPVWVDNQAVLNTIIDWENSGGNYGVKNTLARGDHKHDDKYSLLGHTHAISEVTGLQTALDGKSSTSHTHALVTNSSDGFMSSGDKTKLDGVAVNANNYSHPTGDGNLHVPATGTVNNKKVLMAGATAGNISWSSVDYADVINKPLTFAPSAHSHAISEVTGLQTALDGKVDENISNVSDCNTVKTTGFYHVPASTTNAPTTGVYELTVIGNGTNITQFALSSSVQGIVYLRRSTDGGSTWQTWIQLITTQQVTSTPSNSTTTALSPTALYNLGYTDVNYTIANNSGAVDFNTTYTSTCFRYLTGTLTNQPSGVTTNVFFSQYRLVSTTDYVQHLWTNEATPKFFMRTKTANVWGSWTQVNDWNSILNKPSTFTPSAHSHVVADITDLSTNYYNRSQVDTLVANSGDIRSANANTFTNTNTFTASGTAIKVQPATNVASATKLINVLTNGGATIFEVTHGSGVTINGNLTVTGTTTQSGTQSITGDYNISGNLSVGTNSILGNDPTDTTTVNGTLVINNDLVQKGKNIQIASFPVYGIGGDLQFQTDSTTFDDILSHYSTFDNGGASCLPAIPSGATRKFKLKVVYSTTGNPSTATLKIIQYGTSTDVTSITLPTVNGLATGMARTFLSAEFTTSYTGHTTFQAKCDTASTSLVIKYIEVIAYDYYA